MDAKQSVSANVQTVGGSEFVLDHWSDRILTDSSVCILFAEMDLERN